MLNTTIDPKSFTQHLLEQNDPNIQRSLLDEHKDFLSVYENGEQVVNKLKATADSLLNSDMEKSTVLAGMILYIAQIADEPLYRAKGLRALANIEFLGKANCQRAIELCEQATEIYKEHHQPMEKAQTQLVKIAALSFTGEYDKALNLGKDVMDVFEKQEAWILFAQTKANIATAVFGPLGQDREALEYLNEARVLYIDHQPNDINAITQIDLNRSILLRNLGHFEESIELAEETQKILEQLGHRVTVAHSLVILAETHLIIGHYNQTLKLFEQARNIFLSDRRHYDALNVDLYISYCLLQLQRFDEVLEKSQSLRDGFILRQANLETVKAWLIESDAYIGLRIYSKAKIALYSARDLLVSLENPFWLQMVEMKNADILYYEEEFEQSLSIALRCSKKFRLSGRIELEAEAYLLTARSYIALHLLAEGNKFLLESRRIGQEYALPSILYRSYYFLGQIAEVQGDIEVAFTDYQKSAEFIEEIRKEIMIEYRIDFQSDVELQKVYEALIRLSIEKNQLDLGLDYVEIAKSRVLVELLDYRLNLQIQARTSDDQALVKRLNDLQFRRDLLYRKRHPSKQSDDNIIYSITKGEKTDLEQNIMKLWNELLVRNADYEQEASLRVPSSAPFQEFMHSGRLMLNYFAISNRLIVFLVTNETVKVKQLPCTLADIHRLISLFRLNARSFADQNISFESAYMKSFRRILQDLYQLLIAPIKEDLSTYPQLTIVPYGLLHYLPFHALYDGESFLIEHHEISYLPNASLLWYCNQPRDNSGHSVVFGYDANGQSPYIIQEALVVTRYMAADLFLNEDAKLNQLQSDAVQNCSLLHFATHSNYNEENPLFSELVLADGTLTTLRAFNLKLNASLVTLSGCNTGFNVIRDGDELLGLMRAFLYAGAASLILSIWPTDDRSTSLFMKLFYKRLSQGWTKAAALRAAQLQILHGDIEDINPSCWASFYLVGDTGLL